ADRNRSHWSTSKTPSYTKSVSWQHHPSFDKTYHNYRQECRHGALPFLFTGVVIKALLQP
ncbi:hypothetical protein, partial [Enterobacter hormaechei]|uniref:hypothetical protein n=1 Tax=Enterobacter hormaechei TaxID=158836 RepID=UPI001C8F4775